MKIIRAVIVRIVCVYCYNNIVSLLPLLLPLLLYFYHYYHYTRFGEIWMIVRARAFATDAKNDYFIVQVSSIEFQLHLAINKALAFAYSSLWNWQRNLVSEVENEIHSLDCRYRSHFNWINNYVTEKKLSDGAGLSFLFLLVRPSIPFVPQPLCRHPFLQ